MTPARKTRLKARRKNSPAYRLASRTIFAFYEKHVAPLQGTKINDACRTILVFLKVEKQLANLRLTTLAAIARHDGALPALATSKPKPARPSISKPKPPSVSLKQAFYDSWGWATLRMKVLKANGGRCECCGSRARDTTVGGERVRLHVDHIKPISKFWELRLERANLQILCAECNRGKGAWDATDWREDEASPAGVGR